MSRQQLQEYFQVRNRENEIHRRILSWEPLRLQYSNIAPEWDQTTGGRDGSVCRTSSLHSYLLYILYTSWTVQRIWCCGPSPPPHPTPRMSSCHTAPVCEMQRLRKHSFVLSAGCTPCPQNRTWLNMTDWTTSSCTLESRVEAVHWHLQHFFVLVFCYVLSFSFPVYLQYRYVQTASYMPHWWST